MNFVPPQFEDLSESQKMNIVSLSLNDLQNQVSKIKIALQGDGNGAGPGALERLRVVENYILDTKYWIRFFLGAIIIQTLAFIATIFVALARVYPLLQQLANSTK